MNVNEKSGPTPHLADDGEGEREMPSTQEVEMESDMAEQRGEYKVGGDRSSGFSLRFHKDGIQSEDL